MWHITSEELSKENKSVIVYFPRKKYYSVGFYLSGYWCFDTLMLMKSPPYAYVNLKSLKLRRKT